MGGGGGGGGAMGVPVAWMNACFIEDGGFLEIFYKLTEIPTWSVTINIQRMPLKKYEAPEGGFLTVLYK